MKKTVIIWVAAIVVAIAAIVITSTLPSNKPAINPASNSSSTPGSRFPLAANFTLKDLSGNNVSLSDFKGKPVYINFFATWCPPCRGEMPDIEKMYQKYKDRGLVVLAIDLNEDTGTVQNFISQAGYTFKVLLDQSGVTRKDYDTTSIPVSVFVDKSGGIIAERVGSLTEAEMEGYIAKLV